MNAGAMREAAASKVPAVTLTFWIIKIAATTLGETGGDTLTMTLNSAISTARRFSLALLVAARLAADRARRSFSPGSTG